MARWIRASTGMTLVEVLVAITLLSITLLTYLSVMKGANQAGQKGSYTAIATRAAADQIALAQGTNVSLLVNGTKTYTVAGLPGGTMTVTIGPLAGNPANQYIKQIDITVTWSGPTTTANTNGSITISTLVSAKK
jgi:prepilin-type N-terminal cleavage/methylation domain-containing protein